MENHQPQSGGLPDTLQTLAAVADSLAVQVATLQAALAQANREAHVDRRPALPETEYLTVKQAAAYLGVARSTLYKLIDAGLPTVTLSQLPRLRRSDIDAWVNSNNKKKGDTAA